MRPATPAPARPSPSRSQSQAPPRGRPGSLGPIAVSRGPDSGQGRGLAHAGRDRRQRPHQREREARERLAASRARKVIVRSRPFGVRRAAAACRATADDELRRTLLDGRRRSLEARRARCRRQDLPRRRVCRGKAHASACGWRPRANGRRLRNGEVMTLRAGRRRCRRAEPAEGRADPGHRRRALDDGRGAHARTAVGQRDRGATASAVRSRAAIYRFRVRVPSAGDVWPWPTADSPDAAGAGAALMGPVLERNRGTRRARPRPRVFPASQPRR